MSQFDVDSAYHGDGRRVANADTDEIDDNADVDSAYDSEGDESETMELPSEHWNFRKGFERDPDQLMEQLRYHYRYPKCYLWPISDSELRRLNYLHELYSKLLNDRLLACPIPPEPFRVLDMGTGTGIWADEMATRYQQASVLGVDLGPLFWRRMSPLNCEFQVDRFDIPWDLNEIFDIVHLRDSASECSSLSELLRQAHGALRCGGYLEIVETIYSFQSDGPGRPPDCLNYWWSQIQKARSKCKRPIPDLAQLCEQMQLAGFENAICQQHVLPIGEWMDNTRDKEIGRMTKEHLQMLLMTGTEGPMHAAYDWGRDEVAKLEDRVWDELQSQGNERWFHTSIRCYAQKPSPRKILDS